jgi:hypothetical protein
LTEIGFGYSVLAATQQPAPGIPYTAEK